MKDTLILIAFCFAVFAVVSFLYSYARNWEVRHKAQVDEYNRSFNNIQSIIHSSEVNACNYDHIERLFCSLGKLPHKNKEKSSVLYVAEFLVKFEKETQRRRTAEMEIKSGEEFSPHETFRKN